MAGTTKQRRGSKAQAARSHAARERAARSQEALAQQGGEVYPFAAIVGQDEMKLALLLNAIDPRIGGVIIMGHRGTGKSTAVRGLAGLLPPITKVKDCLYGCDPEALSDLCSDCRKRSTAKRRLPREQSPVPVVDLPLGATEDRVCGTLDIQRALAGGVKAFMPGLLARANRGFLYIDEVNLLEDHLVDVLLDAAASGRNIVEREGISVTHPARFVLVGSGNPEEGELRPQLLDRFGLFTEIETISDLSQRVEIVERRDRFERDAAAFLAEMQTEQERLRLALICARELLAQVTLDRELLNRIAALCLSLQIDGHRGELTIARAARALAAFEGRTEVGDEDVRRVARMSLRHRLRKDPLERGDSGARIDDEIERLFQQPDDGEQGTGEPDKQDHSDASRSSDDSDRGGGEGFFAQPSSGDGVSGLAEEVVIQAEERADGASNRRIAAPAARKRASGSGKRLDGARGARGRYVGSTPRVTGSARVAVDATLRAAAAASRGRKATADDLRFKIFKRKCGLLFIFAMDSSGSMALNRMAQAKGALIQLLQQSYLHRDKVALIGFRGSAAQVLLAPTRSVELARRAVDRLPTGGATPLASGLLGALNLAKAERASEQMRTILVVFTDGRANVALRAESAACKQARTETIDDELQRLGSALKVEGVTTLVVDTVSKFVSGGNAAALADLIEARYVYLPRADTRAIYRAVTSAASAIPV